MTITLTRNAYSPRLLSQELQGIVKPGFIRKQIAKGKLQAQRLGGKNLIIYREDIETWLRNLPSGTEPTNLGGSTAMEKRAREKKRKTVHVVASDYRRRKRMRTARAAHRAEGGAK
jgi:hypothetical protein